MHCSDDHAYRVFKINPTTGEALAVWPGGSLPRMDAPPNLAVDLSGRRLVLYDSCNNVLVLDTFSGSVVHRVPGFVAGRGVDHTVAAAVLWSDGLTLTSGTWQGFL